MIPELPDRLPTVNTRARNPKSSIGTILVEAGRISPLDAERIARQQKEAGITFGEAGLALGILSRADIEFALARQYDYPYLLNTSEARLSSELVAAFQPFSPPVESLRALRSQLALRWFGREESGRALAVIGPERADGRSYLVANLAIVFAQLGQRTLLIDADMRHPRQHELFGLSNNTGLSLVLSGRQPPDAIRYIDQFSNLAILTAGPRPPNPQELLGRRSFIELLNDAEAEFDVVLLDTPAGSEYADAQMVCALAGAAVMATRRNYTNLDDANRLTTSLTRHGVQMLGAVFSEF